MDKQIPLKEQRKRKLLKIGKVAIGVAIVAAGIIWYTLGTRDAVKLSSLKVAEVDHGTIETTASATGMIRPAMEEHVMSPINSRILEVYKSAGDSVEEGEPMMLLNLEIINNELQALYDQRIIKEENQRQQHIKGENDLQNREMQLETKRMNLEQLRQDLRNEQFLDSLGSGTGENVRRAQMALRAAQVELVQLERDLRNQRDFHAADMKTRQIEMDQFLRQITEKENLRKDAMILSPRKAVITRIINEIGRPVSAMSEVAVIADLEHFKIEGSVSDTYAGDAAVGSEVVIKLGREKLPGTITEISPVSQNSALEFTVMPDNNSDPRMKAGMRVDVHIKTSVINDAVRIPNGVFYTNGPGTYELFVLSEDSKELTRRSVTLGKANFEYVEVKKGLAPGESIVINDMSRHRKALKLKVKQ